MTDSIAALRIKRLFDGRSTVLPADRIYALSLLGKTLSDVGREEGVSRSTVWGVVHDKGVSYPVASRISEILEVPLNRLWPDGRYEKSPKEKKAA